MQKIIEIKHTAEPFESLQHERTQACTQSEYGTSRM